MPSASAKTQQGATTPQQREVYTLCHVNGLHGVQISQWVLGNVGSAIWLIWETVEGLQDTLRLFMERANKLMKCYSPKTHRAQPGQTCTNATARI